MKYILLGLAFFCASLSFAQEFVTISPRELYVPAINPGIFREDYRKKANELKCLEADFDQEKQITLLTTKLTSTGNMTFRHDNKFKIQYLTPNKFIFSMQGNKITVKDGDRAASSMSTKNNKLFEQVSQITFNAINGNIFDSKDFNYTILENYYSYLIKLVPKSKELKQYYSDLHLYVNKKTFLIETIIMNEASGDKTEMKFKNFKVNNPVPDEAFIIN